MKSFLTHYFLVVSWGETWFNVEDSLTQQMAEHEDPKESVWKYGKGEDSKDLTFADVISAMECKPNAEFIEWVVYVLHETKDAEPETIIMQSMGCGSSDTLSVQRVLEYAASISAESKEIQDFLSADTRSLI